MDFMTLRFGGNLSSAPKGTNTVDQINIWEGTAQIQSEFPKNQLQKKQSSYRIAIKNLFCNKNTQHFAITTDTAIFTKQLKDITLQSFDFIIKK